MKTIKSEAEIRVLARGGEILARILHTLASHASIGKNILDLEQEARLLCKKYNVESAFLGYQPEGASHPYPAAACFSVNDVVVHGTPTDRALRSGDILKIDMGVLCEGLYTDAALTVAIGSISPVAKKLIQSTKEALSAGIKAVKVGGHIGDIGYAVERQAKKDGFFVLRGLTGHGVGHELHEDPVIFNYGKRHSGMPIKEGMVLAIEPMFSVSSLDVVQNNDESYSSADKSLTAHFEHTIAVTSKGVVVLTMAN